MSLSDKPLHDYQADAINNLRATIGQGIKRIVLQAPCGAGKTRISAEIIELGLRKGNRVVFCVPAISLIDQSVESFYAQGIRGIGVIQADHPMTDWSQPLQVASIQTIQARKSYPEAKIVIIDEAHRLFEAHRKWLTDPTWQDTVFIGLSATPWAKGMKKYFNTLIKAVDTQTLINRGFLSPFRVFAASHPDLTGVRVVAGDYHEGELSNAMQQGSLTADIVKTYKEKWGKGRTLCFAVDKAHAKSLQERFEFAGIKAGYQDALTPADERREIKRKFHNGEYEVVCNIQTLTTGVDWCVDCLILARPTRSEMLYVQIVGRALRTDPSNPDKVALILDHSETTAKLGFVTQIDHDELDDGKPNGKAMAMERKTPLPKECEKCAYLKPAKIRKCPNCGHESRIQSAIIESDGQLIEVTPGTLRKVSKRKPEAFTDDEKQVFFAELRGYAAQHGYKGGWAAFKFKEKFGEFPPRWMESMPASDIMSPGVSLWIRSRQIAWAKSKKPTDSLEAMTQQRRARYGISDHG